MPSPYSIRLPVLNRNQKQFGDKLINTMFREFVSVTKWTVSVPTSIVVWIWLLTVWVLARWLCNCRSVLKLTSAVWLTFWRWRLLFIPVIRPIRRLKFKTFRQICWIKPMNITINWLKWLLKKMNKPWKTIWKVKKFQLKLWKNVFVKVHWAKVLFRYFAEPLSRTRVFNFCLMQWLTICRLR